LRRLLAAALVAALFIVGCGSSSSSNPTLKVSAAASLKKAFTAYGGQLSDAKAAFSFAGSDQLAAQIQQGAKPDVYAAANTKLPDQLYSKGLIEKPVVFATNTLVIAVPSSGSRIGSLNDLTKRRVKIAAGAESVPVGSYTQKVLSQLPAAERAAIVKNIVSSEPDVASVVGKVSEGAADAGFVYITDVKAAGGKLKAIQIPANLNPTAAYGAAVVTGAAHKKQAQEFVDGLVNGKGQDELRAAGFGAPPPQ
jgi:molybdate transport system substrate-binding protein